MRGFPGMTTRTVVAVETATCFFWGKKKNVLVLYVYVCKEKEAHSLCPFPDGLLVVFFLGSRPDTPRA